MNVKSDRCIGLGVAFFITFLIRIRWDLHHSWWGTAAPVGFDAWLREHGF
ncbi:hypothetical protein RE6C_02900 [Rhodopirellula europaea 6C]|uniref:Uncharacterized protein n=1 Tax=Rhodopirellula europaea 6C TaxID=1263867 RepID=M2AHE7_9BACT|nr:hypothetical protein RE6C_02900 [Rhodopirellula europaea 6C]